MKIKLGLLIYTVLLLISQTVIAQKKRPFSEDKLFVGGIYIGGNLSQVDGDYRGGFEKIGLRTGAAVYYRVPNYNWIFQFEIAYSQKGARANSLVDHGVGNYFEKYRLFANYIQTPVILNYYLNEKYLFGAGIAYNAFINSKEDIRTLYSVGNFDPSIFKFQRHTFDYVLQAGWQANSSLLLSIRYEYGLNAMRLWKNTVQGLASSDQYNNTISIGLSYLF